MDADRMLLDFVQARLHYMLGNCPPEEYDSKQVTALISLKRTLSPEIDTAGIQQITYHNSSTQQERIVHISYKPPIKKHTLTALGIAIAASIISIMIMGNTAPSLALPDTGFFIWLRKDSKGAFVVTVPSDDDIEDEKCKDCDCCEKCGCGCVKIQK